MNILKTIHAGSLKFRNIAVLILMVGMPLFVMFMATLIFGIKGDRLVEDPAKGLETYFTSAISMMGMLFPLFLMLLITLIFYLENSSNTWKKIYTLPISRFSVFVEKVFYAVAFTIVFLLIFYILLSIGSQILMVWRPEQFIFSAAAYGVFANKVLLLLLASFSILAIQFFISMNWSNIFVALGTGMMLLISFYILLQGWKYVGYHPYGFVFFSSSKASVHTEIHQLLLSALIALVVLPSAFLLNRNREVL